MVDSVARVKATVIAADSGTDWLQLRNFHNAFDISVVPDGSFNGTVTLQRKRADEVASDARDIETFAAAAEKIGEFRGRWDVRLFVKTGELSAGTVKLELGAD